MLTWSYINTALSQSAFRIYKCYIIIKKYKTFSVLIYSYINTSGNWKNEKLCGNTTPAGRSVFTQFQVFPIFTSVDITVCYIASAETKRDWLIHGHVALDKCNVSLGQ